MKLRNIATAIAGVCTMSAVANAQFSIPGAVSLSGDLSANRTLSADSVYQIMGTVRVPNGVTLTIPAGTLIYGNNNTSQNAIVVSKGGQIIANGTATKPIIFASQFPQGERSAGDWAGLAICGQAPINVAGGSATLEGGTGDTYGGAIANDNSGSLTYVRLEYPGYTFSTNNELNSLTLAGVGSGTTIDYVQASYGQDDAFEFFGGTVNAKHLVAFGTTDDDLDTDFGYIGTIQYMFGMRDNTRADISGSNGIEADNNNVSGGNGATPLSHPKVANYTWVGPVYDGVTSGATNFQSGAHIRRNSRYFLYNSIMAGSTDDGLRVEGNTTVGDGIGLDDVLAAAQCPQPTDLEVAGTLFSTSGATLANPNIVPANATAWINCAAAGNTLTTTHSTLGLTAVGQADLNDPNPIPGVGSPAIGAGKTLPAGFAAGSTSTTYAGAFDPTVARSAQWDAGWTNYNPQLTTYVKHRAGWAMVGAANGTVAPTHSNIYTTVGGGLAYQWTGSGYSTTSTLDYGKGYWVKLVDNRTIEQTGSTRTLPQTTSGLVVGWNMVSTGSSKYATANATTTTGTFADGSAASAKFYYWNGSGYDIVTGTAKLEPGKAYWIKMTAGGSMTFNP